MISEPVTYKNTVLYKELFNQTPIVYSSTVSGFVIGFQSSEYVRDEDSGSALVCLDVEMRNVEEGQEASVDIISEDGTATCEYWNNLNMSISAQCMHLLLFH